MFKQLEDWMNEVEQEIYNDYMRAFNAANIWKSAIAARRASLTISIPDIRESLKGDYRSYSCFSVTPNYRELEVEVNGHPWVALIDTIKVGDLDYDKVVVFTELKSTTTHADWGKKRLAEQDFIKRLMDDTGFNKFLRDHRAYAADYALVCDRDEEWIKERAHKDMLKHKKAIEAKIVKICEAIDSIYDDYGEYYVKGTNGRTAHLWKIIAGGWNIQRMHMRVLCKEVRAK